MPNNKEEILSLLKETHSLLKGHFRLSSGLHSGEYIQCAQVLSYPKYAQKLAEALAKSFIHDKIDLVIGPALGGVILAQEMGRALGVRALFAERKEKDFSLRRGFSIPLGARVLVVEDVITTGGSVQEVIELVKQEGGQVAGVAFLIDRSGGRVDFGVPKKNLLTLEVKTYLPEECPLCQEGLPLEKPGSRK